MMHFVTLHTVHCVSWVVAVVGEGCLCCLMACKTVTVCCSASSIRPNCKKGKAVREKEFQCELTQLDTCMPEAEQKTGSDITDVLTVNIVHIALNIFSSRFYCATLKPTGS